MICVYTVCSRSHLPMALGLGDSLRESNEGVEFVIFVFDDKSGPSLPVPEPDHRVVEVAGLGLADFGGMRERYDDLELSCAMKPHLAAHLLASRHDIDKVFYVDADTRFFAPLSRAASALDHHAILLTPHILSPYPDDGFDPELEAHLKTGLYNAGFFGVARNTESDRFLRWWSQLLVEKCRIAPHRGHFVDQIWLNFAPLFFEDVLVFRDPGYNVAYWNLHERPLGVSGNGFLAASEPLVLFHFSGYRLDRPEELSRHQNRYEMTADPVLSTLFERYRESLQRRGFQPPAQQPEAPAAVSPRRSIVSRVVGRLRRVAGSWLRR